MKRYLVKKNFMFLPFIMMGGYFIISPFFTLYTLTCTRVNETQGRCIVRQTFMAIPTREIPIQTIQSAKLQSKSGYRTSRYWVRLQTTAKEIHLSESSFSSDAPQQVVDELNGFLSDPKMRSLRVTQNDIVPGFIWGGLFGFCGLISFLFKQWYEP